MDGQDPNNTTPPGGSTPAHSDKSPEALLKAQELGKHALEEAKAATATAKNAFLTLLGDPVGGQAAAIASLGPKGTLQSGIVFVAAFVIATFTAALFGANLLSSLVGGGAGQFQAKMLFSAIFGAVVTSAALYGSIWMAARFFGTRKLDWSETLFVTGVCLFPATVAILLGLILIKIGLFKIASTLLIIAFSLLVLLLNACLTTLVGIPARLAFLLTPAVLVVTSFLISLVG